MISMEGYGKVIERVRSRGQDHVFVYWDALSDKEKTSLLEELSGIDFDLLSRLYDNAQLSVPPPGSFEPAPYIPLPVCPEEEQRYDEARRVGEDIIRAGRVAVFTVAGGQGSRLGFDGPKGALPTAPVSDKTLFQLHGEKILTYRRKYGVPIPWLIMTSRVNHAETVDFFRRNTWFGLPEGDIIFFSQNMIPSLDLNGKLIMKGPSGIFMNPDGHGGSLTALGSSGALDELDRQGVDIISYFQVDNPLVRVIDPVFIGFHSLNKADASSKGLEKVSPGEKVGVFVKFEDGTTGVVEYIDLPESLAEERGSEGKLRFLLGSIAIHLFPVSFIRSITGKSLSLPYHTARKKLNAHDPAAVGGVREIEGFKFEKFVMDALTFASNNMILETRREEEFAPVKNAVGVDSLESCRKLMEQEHRRWLSRAGISVPGEVEVLEISPLLAVEPGDLNPDLSVPAQKRVHLEG